jgi:hypothetical protein
MCTLSTVVDCSCCDVSSASQQFVHFGLTVAAALVGDLVKAGYSPLAVRGSEDANQHYLKHGDACRNLPLLYVACLCCGLDDSKAGVLSNNASVYFLRTSRASVLVSCRYVSCSLFWTCVMPLCGLCSISTAPSRTHTTFITTGRNVRHYW